MTKMNSCTFLDLLASKGSKFWIPANPILPPKTKLCMQTRQFGGQKYKQFGADLANLEVMWRRYLRWSGGKTMNSTSATTNITAQITSTTKSVWHWSNSAVSRPTQRNWASSALRHWCLCWFRMPPIRIREPFSMISFTIHKPIILC